MWFPFLLRDLAKFWHLDPKNCRSGRHLSLSETVAERAAVPHEDSPGLTLLTLWGRGVQSVNEVIGRPRTLSQSRSEGEMLALREKESLIEPSGLGVRTQPELTPQNGLAAPILAQSMISPPQSEVIAHEGAMSRF